MGYDPVPSVELEDAPVSANQPADVGATDRAGDRVAPAMDRSPDMGSFVDTGGDTLPVAELGAELPRDAATPDLAAVPPPDLAPPPDVQPPDLPRDVLLPADAPPGWVGGLAACPSPPPPADVIADFEDGTPSVKAAGGRQARLFTIVTTGAGNLGVTPLGTTAICGSQRLLSLSATGITPGRGHIQGRISLQGQTTVDARGYTGVRLTARGDRPLQVMLKFPDSDTISSLPYDHFAVPLDVTAEARVFTVPFSVLRQSGVGLARPALNLQQVFAIEFQVVNAGTFTLLIDEVVWLP